MSTASDLGTRAGPTSSAQPPGLNIRAWLRGSAMVLGVAAAFVLVLPRIAGAPWSDLVAGFSGVPVGDLGLLTLLWIAGLSLHTVTLTAALPRLTHKRALTLSLTGSAIANVLPLGGAAGLTLNYRMARSWGFSTAAITTYTVLTNIWDVLAKLCLPAIALGWLVLSGTAVAGTFVITALGATVALAVLSAALAAVIGKASVAARVDHLVDSALSHLGPLADRLRPRGAIIRLQSEAATVVSRAWPRLTLGMALYLASLALLLWSCLHLTGAHLAVPAVFAGFAFERLLTLAGLTPGGAGVIEVGLSGLLLVLGGTPVGVVSGVLLYRAFTFGAEIPIGGIGLAAWLWRHRVRRTGAGPGPQEATT